MDCSLSAPTLSVPFQESAHKFLAERLSAATAHYRVPESHFGKPAVRELLSSTACASLRPGDGFLDVPWPVSLTPMTLSAQLISDVTRIGALVPGALRCSWDVLTSSPDVQSFIFRSPKSEGEHFHRQDCYPLDDAPLFRLDLLLEDSGTRVVPWLVDINLMAGMAGITGGIHEAYDPYAEQVWGVGTSVGGLDLDAWAEGFAERLSGPVPGGDDDTIDLVIRAGHALVPDAQGVVAALRRVHAQARLTTLDELAVVDGKLVNSSGDAVVRILRQVRRTTKHGASNDIRMREAQAFDSLTDSWLSGVVRMTPGFDMYLESHAWMHYWRGEEFTRAFRSAHGDADHRFLMSHIPRTLRVVDETHVASDTRSVRARRPDDVDGAVLKRADSTGGAGLLMAGQPAAAHERAAMEASLSASHEDGLLLQERVRQSRYQFPAVPVPGVDSEPPWVAGRLKLAAYFRGGTFLGAHALLTPDDRSAFPSSSTLRLLPLFVPVYGDRG